LPKFCSIHYRQEKIADMGLSDLAEDQINPVAKWSTIVEKSEKEATSWVQ